MTTRPAKPTSSVCPGSRLMSVSAVRTWRAARAARASPATIVDEGEPEHEQHDRRGDHGAGRDQVLVDGSTRSRRWSRAGSAVTVASSVRTSPVTVVAASMVTEPPVDEDRLQRRRPRGSPGRRGRRASSTVAADRGGATGHEDRIGRSPARTVTSPLNATAGPACRDRAPGQRRGRAGAARPRASADAGQDGKQRVSSAILLGRVQTDGPTSSVAVPVAGVIGRVARMPRAIRTVYHRRHNRIPPPGSASRAESVAIATDPRNLIRLVPAKEAGPSTR